MKVIGIAFKKGEFNGQAYHNVVFHCTQPAELKNDIGLLTEIVKVKHSRLNECFGQLVTDDDVYSCIGQELAFGYDKYQNVNLIRVIELKEAEAV